MHLTLRIAAALALAIALPASAAVSGVSPSGFLVTHRIETKAPPADVYGGLANPAKWWSDAHTWSRSAANLRLRAVAGGCFCETWDRNSVEHARVVAVMPGKWLRMEGALGPLQEMAVNGVLDFRMEPRAAGATLTATYRVRGSPDAGLDKIASAVDEVIGEQVKRLADYVDTPFASAKPLKLEEHSFDAGGARLRYLETGAGEPVILLHDKGASSESQWVESGVIRAVADNYRAYALDAREPADVVRLMDHLGIAKAHVVGYGLGAQQAAKAAAENPSRFQTLTLAGATSLRRPSDDPARRDLLVADDRMVALQVPTVGIVGMLDPAIGDFIELKRVMPRLIRMTAIEGATHETAIASPDFVVALMYFLRYHPMR